MVEKYFNSKAAKFIGFTGIALLLSGAAWFGGYRSHLDSAIAQTDSRVRSIELRIEKIEADQRMYREKILVYMAATDAKLDSIIKQTANP